MLDNNFKYQPVIYPDGTVSIHETIHDNEGNITSASYEPVRLEATSIGALEMLLRQVYRQLLRTKPITEDELEAMIYGSESIEDIPEDEDDDNVIDLVTYFADPNYYK